ncbi:hypothetical protein BLA6993_05513 [Burkholderia lata]|uniref:hypothetical protein n=1 Tax=Burkholderia lata (strain ATCC 17760 / DSM 23089 / LMG 22485 / NCIMB 9086 / R18194 / 383) TaxID=482957 RepID=UPI0014530D55|nr:hypothetical protein [Burkholderia lata]VWC14421.1 hypothetical protein BLA6993_05513 [Burkholderia lata]
MSTLERKPPYQPDSLQLFHMRVTVIPHMLVRIHAAQQALELEKKYTSLDTIEIFRAAAPPQRVLFTVLGGYTQPVISIAALQCRVLLEFLGLTVSKRDRGSLVPTKDRRIDGDIGIEHYVDVNGQPLGRLTREQALGLVTNPSRAERAWTTVVEFANQRLAHATDDYLLNGKSVRPHLYNAFRTVPELVSKAFLVPIEGE